MFFSVSLPFVNALVHLRGWADVFDCSLPQHSFRGSRQYRRTKRRGRVVRGLHGRGASVVVGDQDALAVGGRAAPGAERAAVRAGGALLLAIRTAHAA
jgi:hypothetical protein